MIRSLLNLFGAFALAATFLAAPAYGDADEANELVDESVYTAEKLWKHQEFGKYLKKYSRQAKAIIIVPNLLKGGFIIGGEGGSGVLLARGDTGEWSYPGFVSLGAASIGLQIGGQSSEMVLLVMTGDGLQAILNDQVKIGGELDGAVGPHGAGVDASTTTNLDVDVLSYSVAKGAFIGANIEGTVIIPRESLMRDYYGQSLTTEDVVLHGKAANAQADNLRATLKRLVQP